MYSHFPTGIPAVVAVVLFLAFAAAIILGVIWACGGLDGRPWPDSAWNSERREPTRTAEDLDQEAAVFRADKRRVEALAEHELALAFLEDQRRHFKKQRRLNGRDDDPPMAVV